MLRGKLSNLRDLGTMSVAILIVSKITASMTEDMTDKLTTVGIARTMVETGVMITGEVTTVVTEGD